MNEEIEHASMVLEWFRRHVPKIDAALKTYLFTAGDGIVNLSISLGCRCFF